MKADRVVVFLAAAVLGAGSAAAADEFPARKPGLWEVAVENDGATRQPMRQCADEIGTALAGIDEQVEGRQLVQGDCFLAPGKLFEQGAGGQRRALAAEPDQLDQQGDAGLAQLGKGPRRP